MHQQGGKDLSTTQLKSTFDGNVERMEKLYLYYLAFIKELDHFGLVYDDEIRTKYTEAARSATAHLKLRENPVIRTIADSPELEKRLTQLKVSFNYEVDDELVKKVFLDIKNSEFYKDYIELIGTADQHEELVLHIFKHYSENYQLFEQHFEEEYPNFLDDKKLVASMLKKTISNIQQEKDSWLIEFVQDWDNTIGFGHALIEKVVKNEEELSKIVKDRIIKWEPGQVAILDTIILKMGIAEFLHFPSIPPTVTINEYVELAKNYSPPNSKKFVNGVLDNVNRTLASQKQ